MKTNSDLSADESATASTTKPESGNVNMSAGAEMLIERMKTNPEGFKYGGRFYRVTQELRSAGGNGWISHRDRVALENAYADIFTEAEFSEWVYSEIFNPKEEETYGHQTYTQALGQSIMQTKQAISAQTINNAFKSAMAISSSGNIGLGTPPPPPHRPSQSMRMQATP